MNRRALGRSKTIRHSVRVVVRQPANRSCPSHEQTLAAVEASRLPYGE